MGLANVTLQTLHRLETRLMPEHSQDQGQLQAEVERLRKEVDQLSSHLEELESIRTKMEESEERFRMVVENTPGVVFMYLTHPDESRSPLYSGPGMEELFGEDTSAAIGDDVQAFFEHIPEEDRERIRKASVGAEKTGKPFDTEYRVKLADGGEKWVRSTSRATQLDNGDIRWQGVLIDINRRKLAEQALQAERERAQRIEVEAERLRTASRVAASIAHEFNNPLAVIQGAIDLLEMKKIEDPSVRKNMTKISKQIARMQELVQKLLTVKEYKELEYAMGEKIFDLHLGNEP